MFSIKSTARCFSTKFPTNLKGKKKSSQEWLIRQFKDPYVEQSRRENYRCRSSYKLIEINQKHKILSHGHVVLDIGCAPGSWSQVCVNAVNSDNSSPNKPKGLVIGVDKLQIYPLESLIFFGNSDFTAIETQRKIMTALNGRKVNCVLSDMAPNATGVKSMDQHNIMDLANAVFNFAKIVSTENSSLVVKVWSNGDLNKFVETLKQSYEVVKYVKPEASRGDSAEIFIVAKNYKAVIA